MKKFMQRDIRKGLVRAAAKSRRPLTGATEESAYAYCPVIPIIANKAVVGFPVY